MPTPPPTDNDGPIPHFDVTTAAADAFASARPPEPPVPVVVVPEVMSGSRPGKGNPPSGDADLDEMDTKANRRGSVVVPLAQPTPEAGDSHGADRAMERRDIPSGSGSSEHEEADLVPRILHQGTDV